MDSATSSRYSCSECQKVLDDPVVCEGCSIRVCRCCCPTLSSDSENTAQENRPSESGDNEQLTCPRCKTASCNSSTEAASQLAMEVSNLLVHCPQTRLGCTATMPLHELRSHVISQCSHTLLHCPHEGCGEDSLDRNTYEAHVTGDCEYRIVVCVACGVRLAQRDLCSHQQERSCFYQLQRQRMVQSQQETSNQLRTHRMKILQARHATEQMERRLLKQHTQNQQKALRRVSSAPAVRLSLSNGLLGAMGSYRVGSAVPHFSKNLQQSSLSTPMSPRNYTAGGGGSAAKHITRPMSCGRCTTRFAPASNRSNACQYHRGPVVSQFGGTCINCGRWRTVDGCQTGFHMAK